MLYKFQIQLKAILSNLIFRIELEEGDLKEFLDETKDLSSEERGNKLVGAQAISNTHEELAHEGQTEVSNKKFFICVLLKEHLL